MNSDIKSARVHVEPVPVIFRWGNSKLPQSMDKPIILHFSVPSLVSETSILEIKILIFRFPVQLLLTVFYRLCGYGERYKDDNKHDRTGNSSQHEAGLKGFRAAQIAEEENKDHDYDGRFSRECKIRLGIRSEIS